MGDDNALIKIDLSEISKSATILVEKISDAVGGLFKPFQIKRVAKAEAEADIIRANTEIKVTSLQRRAMHRLLAEEAKKQHNIEAITVKALPDLKPDAKPDKIEDDWIATFFERCRTVSNEEMQSLWARILAGEGNSPGTFSKRTLSIVSELDRGEAALFTNMCGFAFTIGNPTPLIFDFAHPIYVNRGLNFGSLTHLETAGLLHISGVADYLRTELPKKFPVSYFGQNFLLEFEHPHPSQKHNLNIGSTMFTLPGAQLASICCAQPVEGFPAYVKEHWKKYNVTIEPQPHANPSNL
jgi:hypothetical protein